MEEGKAAPLKRRRTGKHSSIQQRRDERWPAISSFLRDTPHTGRREEDHPRERGIRMMSFVCLFLNFLRFLMRKRPARKWTRFERRRRATHEVGNGWGLGVVGLGRGAVVFRQGSTSTCACSRLCHLRATLGGCEPHKQTLRGTLSVVERLVPGFLVSSRLPSLPCSLLLPRSLRLASALPLAHQSLQPWFRCYFPCASKSGTFSPRSGGAVSSLLCLSNKDNPT